METFLILNGHELNADVDDAESLFLKLAGGDVERDELVGWITANASQSEKQFRWPVSANMGFMQSLFEHALVLVLARFHHAKYPIPIHLCFGCVGVVKIFRGGTCRNMKKADYLAMLGPIVAEYRQHGYAFWLPHVISTKPIVSYRIAEDGRKCCVDISAFWDDRPNGHIRVAFAIDDGGSRSLRPVGADFIVAPDGTFVGD